MLAFYINIIYLKVHYSIETSKLKAQDMILAPSAMVIGEIQVIYESENKNNINFKKTMLGPNIKVKLKYY